jgi:hypothetical protein
LEKEIVVLRFPINSFMEEATPQEAAEVIQSKVRPERLTYDKGRGRKKKKGPKNYTKNVYDPFTQQSHIVPQEPLSRTADTKALVQRVNQLTTLVKVQATLISEWRSAIASSNHQTNVPVEAVHNCARSGLNQVQISNLLGFSAELFKTRKDLHDAWNTGRAELQLTLSEKQIETALKGNPLLQIFLGKQILGQTDTPPVAVQVNVDNGGSLRNKIKEQREAARKEFQNAASEVIDVEVTDVQTTDVSNG